MARFNLNYLKEISPDPAFLRAMLVQGAASLHIIGNTIRRQAAVHDGPGLAAQLHQLLALRDALALEFQPRDLRPLLEALRAGNTDTNLLAATLSLSDQIDSLRPELEAAATAIAG